MRRVLRMGLFVALGTLLANAMPDIKRYLRISRM
jgi:hypothetical protein